MIYKLDDVLKRNPVEEVKATNFKIEMEKLEKWLQKTRYDFIRMDYTEKNIVLGKEKLRFSIPFKILVNETQVRLSELIEREFTRLERNNV